MSFQNFAIGTESFANLHTIFLEPFGVESELWWIEIVQFFAYENIVGATTVY